MAKKAPGKAHREGMTIVDLMDMFPTEEAATEWFETIIWPDGRHCPKCGSVRTREASHAKMPYWCTDCRSYFSVKTGTAMQRSKIPLRKWAIAIYLCLTSLEIGFVHEAATRHRRVAADRVVHAASDPRSLGGRR